MEETQLSAPDAAEEAILRFVLNSDPEEALDPFLRQVDTFDLGEFLRASQFSAAPAPSDMFLIPPTRTYRGLREMMCGELEFLKAAAVSRSRKDVTLYSDFPMLAMARDREFRCQWLRGMASLLQKGLHLNIVHDVSRPFGELLLGLEQYLPMYMTGLITAWCLPSSQSEVFHHLLRVSGSASLRGSAIAGHYEEGAYYFSRRPEDVEDARRIAARLLEKAEPLLQVFRADRSAEFRRALYRLQEEKGSRRLILPSPPVGTMSEKLLRRILARTGVESAATRRILRFARLEQEAFKQMMAESPVLVEVPEWDEEEFCERPPQLDLSKAFLETTVPYTREEYQDHLEELELFASAFPDTIVRRNGNRLFRNITVEIVTDRCVLVSKAMAPNIHFIIRNPRLVEAFENFDAPVGEM